MCLGVPAKVLRKWIREALTYAEVDLGGITQEIIIATDDEIREGDYVIVHAGIAISKINEDELEETLRLYRELRLEYT
ncbi:MAG: HypC/HybG/HupF family hydrogenase formation chaperone [Desulfurococcaceae archaeon TW002]